MTPELDLGKIKEGNTKRWTKKVSNVKSITGCGCWCISCKLVGDLVEGMVIAKEGYNSHLITLHRHDGKKGQFKVKYEGI